MSKATKNKWMVRWTSCWGKRHRSYFRTRKEARQWLIQRKEIKATARRVDY